MQFWTVKFTKQLHGWVFRHKVSLLLAQVNILCAQLLLARYCTWWVSLAGLTASMVVLVGMMLWVSPKVLSYGALKISPCASPEAQASLHLRLNTGNALTSSVWGNTLLELTTTLESLGVSRLMLDSPLLGDIKKRKKRIEVLNTQLKKLKQNWIVVDYGSRSSQLQTMAYWLIYRAYPALLTWAHKHVSLLPVVALPSPPQPIKEWLSFSRDTQGQLLWGQIVFVQFDPAASL